MKHLARFLIAVMLFSVLAMVPAGASGESSTLSDLLSQLTGGQTSSEETADAGELQAAVAEYLDSQEYSYSYDETLNYFSYSIKLDSALGSCKVGILFTGDGFQVMALSPIRPRASDPAQLALAADFLTRANYNMSLGNFEMDYTDGEVRYKTSIKCFDRIPSQQEIEWLVDIPPIMIEKYGDGLASVLLAGIDPAEAIRKIEE